MSSYLRDWLEANDYVVVVKEIENGIQIDLPKQIFPLQLSKESRLYTYDKDSGVLSCRSDVNPGFTVVVPSYAIRLALALEIKARCVARGYDESVASSVDKNGEPTIDWPMGSILMDDESLKWENSLRKVFVEGADVDYNVIEGYNFLVKFIGAIK